MSVTKVLHEMLFRVTYTEVKAVSTRILNYEIYYIFILINIPVNCLVSTHKVFGVAIRLTGFLGNKPNNMATASLFALPYQTTNDSLV